MTFVYQIVYNQNIIKSLMQTVAIQTRVPKVLKTKVVQILSSLGLDLSSATRIFYAKIVEQKGLPFLVKKEPEILWGPNEEQEKAFQRSVAEKDLAKIWSKSSENVWDEWAKNAPSIDTV